MIAKTAILPIFHLYVDQLVCTSHAVVLLGAILVVWRAEFPRDDVIHLKWTRAVITKLQRVRFKGAIGASLKLFEFVTEGVYSF